MATLENLTVFLNGNDDPYLQYQPSFAYTLPVQLLVTGITLTLLGVLLIHLLFTTQYHYPLAPLNYILQLSSILVVLISVIVKIVVILTHSADNADFWPYDLDYVAVPIPADEWSTADNAGWFFLQALNNGLANITHVQFLTLLYPSRTEARLIIFVLGPLAIVSSGLVFTALSPNQTVLDLGDAIRNVFNSTLLLIFTISLALWGFLVNRRRAWRTDGGTAIFGMGALGLACISTIVNFVAIKEDGIDWLQHLLWAAVLWQTWLGWWWWVGSGMGIGEVEDMIERAEKKKRKQARRDHRKRVTGSTNGQAKTRNRATSLASLAEFGSVSASAMAGFTSGVAGILRTGTETLTRRRPVRSNPGKRGGNDVEEGLSNSPIPESIQLDDMRSGVVISSASPRPESGSTGSGSVPQAGAEVNTGSSGGTGLGNGTGHNTSTNSETSSTSRTPSLHTPKSIGSFLAFPTTWLQVYLRRLKKAHEDAAKRQALERAELRQRIFAGAVDVSDLNGGGGTGRGGKGKGKEKTKGKGKGKARQRSALSESAVIEGEGVGWGLGSFGIKEHQESARRLQKAGEQLREGRLLSIPDDDEELRGDLNDAGPSSRPIRGLVETGVQGEEKDWEDIDGSSSSDNRFRRRREKKDEEGIKGSGWSWWGPLREWRLADRTVY